MTNLHLALRRTLTILISGILANAALTACHDEADTPLLPDDSGVLVGFTTDVDSVSSPWRDAPDTRASATEPITSVDDLKGLAQGFGVFAYLTDGNLWREVKDKLKDVPFFMQNQQVTWGYRTSASATTEFNDWFYTPPKYWPNSDDNATPRYVSFFAYAPYYSGEGKVATGVSKLMPSSDTDRSPKVTYKLGKAGQQVDMVYAQYTDATRNGEGLVYPPKGGAEQWQRVELQFKHALCGVDIYVQRLYDEPQFSGKKPDDELSVPMLLIEGLTLGGGGTSFSGFYDTADFDLSTGKWDNFEATATPPNTSLEYGPSLFSEAVSGDATSTSTIRYSELDKWGNKVYYDKKAKVWLDGNDVYYDDEKKAWLDGKDEVKDVVGAPRYYGVADDEQLLMATGRDLVFLPQTLTLTPTITYAMIAQDDDLLLSTLTDSQGRTYSRLQNTVTANPVTIKFEAGKKYKLMLRIGVERVLFEVASVTDWDFPMRFRHQSTIDDFNPEEQTHVLNEADTNL